MHCKIHNNTTYDLQQLEQLTKDFLPFAQKRIGFNKPPVINFASDKENSENPLGKTGYYSPSNMEITIFVDNRHVKDVLRSLSHELVHHGQNCRGEFDREFSTDVGYAQDNEFLRGMEDEAYREGNFCLRDWEDEIKKSHIKHKQLNETIYKRIPTKGEGDMSTKDWKDQELNDLLMEKWGYKLPKKEKLNEEVEETPYFDTSKGGDYTTGQKTLPHEEADEPEKDKPDDDATAEEDNPLSVERRSESVSSEPIKETKKKNILIVKKST